MKKVISMALCTALMLISTAMAQMSVQKARKTVTLTGYTRAAFNATISAEISGKLIQANYDVGDTIADPPIFVIDQTFIDLEIQKTRQALAKMDISLKQSDSNVAYLKKEYVRIEALHKGDRATEVHRDQAKQAFEQADLANQSLLLDKAALKTGLEELLERKNRYTLHATPGWVVVQRNVEPGEIIGQGTPLARAADFRTLVVPLALSTEAYQALKALPASFAARLEDEPVTAEINWVNPEFNEQTRKLSVELKLHGQMAEQRGGLRFALDLDLETKGLLVPKAAVTSRYENPRVRIADTGQTVNIMILDESGENLLIAEDPRLPVGTRLSPAQ